MLVNLTEEKLQNSDHLALNVPHLNEDDYRRVKMFKAKNEDSATFDLRVATILARERHFAIVIYRSSRTLHTCTYLLFSSVFCFIQRGVVAGAVLGTLSTIPSDVLSNPELPLENQEFCVLLLLDEFCANRVYSEEGNWNDLVMNVRELLQSETIAFLASRRPGLLKALPNDELQKNPSVFIARGHFWSITMRHFVINRNCALKVGEKESTVQMASFQNAVQFGITWCGPWIYDPNPDPNSAGVGSIITKFKAIFHN